MKAIIDLTERFLPNKSKYFKYEIIPSVDGMDTFQLDYKDGKIVLRGNNKNSIALALGWYLKYTLKQHISWCGTRIPEVTGDLPKPEFYERVIKQKYRSYMNYCTHSYSAAWWDWERWEYEIDMMALNGINMPLAVTGVESVWYKTLLDLGFSDKEAREFLVGPGFLAWQWMTNIEGHGGPLPLSWIKSHEELGKKIIEREREFDMIPVQQGFSGFVPNLMAKKFPESKFMVKKSWNNIGVTTELDPLDPLFKKIGLKFLQNQKEIFGAYGFYACDPFHEGHPPVEGKEYLQQVANTICDLYKEFDENYIWIMQAWSLRKDIAESVSKDRLIIFDLDPVFPINLKGVTGYNYLVGVLHNFGARMSSLHGDLKTMAENRFYKAQESAPDVIGTGLFMEGIGQNPVFYDLGLEMLTRDDKADIYEWIKGYIERRYGELNDNYLNAWKILIDNVYIRNTDFVERSTVICTRPCLNLRGTGPQDKFEIHYDNKVLTEAIDLMLKSPNETEGYKYDLLDLCRQMLSNYAQELYKKIPEAFYKRDKAGFEKYTDEFLTLLDEIDSLLAIRPQWTIQKWISDARNLAETNEEKDLHEYNARMQVTIWGNEQDSFLFDYAWKEWSGLISSYYAVRWKKFFTMLEEKLENGEEYSEDGLRVFENRIVWNANEFYKNLGKWEGSWAQSTDEIPLKQTDFSYTYKLLDKYIKKVLEA